MKPTDAGALVSEATTEEIHQFSLFNTMTGAAQMKAKYDQNTHTFFKMFHYIHSYCIFIYSIIFIK